MPRGANNTSPAGSISAAAGLTGARSCQSWDGSEQTGAEKAAVIVTTNLPFAGWSQVIPNPRLCKALIDRLTDQAHIITTGADSYRFRRTTAQRRASKT